MLCWFNEVCDWFEFDVLEEGVKVVKFMVKEIDMVEKLIDDMSGIWDFVEYYDIFCDDIFVLVNCKVCEGCMEFVELMEVE